MARTKPSITELNKLSPQDQEIELIAYCSRREIAEFGDLLTGKQFAKARRRLLSLLCDEFVSKRQGVLIKDQLREINLDGMNEEDAARVVSATLKTTKIIYGHYGKGGERNDQRIEQVLQLEKE